SLVWSAFVSESECSQAEVSIMKMSRRVADTESSSNGEAALLEELEDEKVPKSCLCLTVVLILDATLWTSGSSMASMATDCRGGMYCLMSCMLSSDPLCSLSHLAWPPTDSWVQVPDLKRRNTRPHPLSGRRGLQRFSSV
uniref:Uncharacterized protein n=1 Tax=Aegilops tauschii subsp. strangulata TaxID=200361 RepID=A0A453K5E1_AEGTS